MVADQSPATPSDGLSSTHDPIPVEILSQIVHQLSTPELARCAKASRTFYLLVTPLLYKSVTIDLSLPVNPLCIRVVPIPHSSYPLLKLTSPTEDDVITTIPLDDTPYPLPVPVCLPFPVPHRFSFITYLVSQAHNIARCVCLRSCMGNSNAVQMPNLKTLRMLPNPRDARLDLCTHHLSANCALPPVLCCPLVRHLRPARIIMGGLTTSLSGSARGLYSPQTPLLPYSPGSHLNPYFFSSFVKELVIHVGMLSGVQWGVGAEASAFFLAHLPATVDKVTFILSTAQNGWSAFKESEECYDDYNVRYTADSLVEACLGSSAVIEVVDHETTGSCWTEDGHEDDTGLPFDSYIKWGVVTKLCEKAWSEEKVLNRVCSIRFVGGAEWAERVAADPDLRAETPEDWDKVELAKHLKTMIFQT